MIIADYSLENENPIHITFYAKWPQRKLFTRLYTTNHLRFEYVSIIYVKKISEKTCRTYL